MSNIKSPFALWTHKKRLFADTYGTVTAHPPYPHETLQLEELLGGYVPVDLMKLPPWTATRPVVRWWNECQNPTWLHTLAAVLELGSPHTRLRLAYEAALSVVGHMDSAGLQAMSLVRHALHGVFIETKALRDASTSVARSDANLAASAVAALCSDDTTNPTRCTDLFHWIRRALHTKERIALVYEAHCARVRELIPEPNLAEALNHAVAAKRLREAP